MHNQTPERSFVIDEASFIVLYNTYWHEALTLAQQLLQDSHAAEDIVQNVFISFWNRRDALRISQPVEHYLKKAIKFAVAAYIRDQVKKEMLPLEDTQLPGSSDADHRLLHKELLHSVTDVVNQLPGQSRKVCELRLSHALDNTQTSALLGISEKTVRNQLSGALKRIRHMLAREGYQE